MKKLMSFITLLLMALACVFAVNGPTFAQGNDPAAIYKALTAAQNAHDANAATALFTDDAAAVAGTRMYKGSASIKEWFQVQALGNYQAVMGTPVVTGDTLLIQDQISNDTYKKLGVAPLTDDVQIVVAGGKIKSYALRLNARSAAAYAAALSKAPQGTDPGTVTNALIAAENSGNMDAALALFADDAVVIAAPTSAQDSGIYSGKAAVTTYWQGQFAQHPKLSSPFVVQLASDMTIANISITGDDIAKLNIGPLNAYAYVVVQDGKIEQFMPNLTPASAAKVAAATAPK